MKQFFASVKEFLKKNIFVLTIVLIMLIVDQATKLFFDGKVINVFDGIFSFTSTHNTGAGFSIMSGKVWLLILISIVFLIGIFIFNHFYKSESKLYKLGFSLIIAGAIGNLIDRIFLGYVRDFVSLDIIHFAVFNFADACLTIGVILLCIYLLFFDKKKVKQDENK